MKVSEYVANFIAGISPRVYGVCGAGAMHLNDAIANHPGIKVISMQHEQAAAMAAEAEARVTGAPSVVSVTAGPGGTNAMTGVACAYVDSIPMLVIAGQVTSHTMKGNSGARQVGMNELDMVGMMTPITKFAVTVLDPNNIRVILERAVHVATICRPGPVFVEIPLDVQAANIDPENLHGFGALDNSTHREDEYDTMVRQVENELSRAKRPVVIVGNGVRIAGAVDEFRRIFDNLGIPVVSSWGAADVMPTDHPFYIGRCGIFGDRASNFAVQGADLILAVGTRLSVAQIGHASDKFAPSAKKIIIDIDTSELHKKPTIKADVGICADVKRILSRMKAMPHNCSFWMKHCQNMKEKYRKMVIPVPSRGISSYGFIETLSDQMEDNAVVVTDVGFCFIPTFQTLRLRSGQRLIHSGGVSPMGWGIPAAIGAACAGPLGPVVCLTGDGGAMMNLQELQTIAHHRLKIAIFVFENDGYATMKIAQNNHFNREVMAGPRSGLSLPDFTKVAKAFNITTMEFNSLNVLAHAMDTIFDIASQGPIVVVMHMDPAELISPRVQAAMEDGKFKPADISDMWPHLPREEYADCMNQKETGVPSDVVRRLDERR
jgi:acetolactate synthase I/II/III large subunit